MYDPERIPVHTKQAIDSWGTGRQPGEGGSFMRAVLKGDMIRAVHAADEENFEAFAHIIGYCYHNLPAASWGSEYNYNSWLQASISARHSDG